MNPLFSTRNSVEQVEEGLLLAPKFDCNGLIPVVTTDANTGEVLMHAYMNEEALVKTIETGEGHYYSRSRQQLWHKGQSSGLVQKVQQLAIDDDQDCLWMQVEVAGSGASCHVGYRSCFYRCIPTGKSAIDSQEPIQLTFTETEKTFDPKTVYGNAPNPTQL
ncbi:phosphoribosyl-AMP cyclohydrolase [Trichodesmium erythraeum IMS101]|uniref:Histidine biosynthesis bifunctional protein HisIE n=1 Tax=Trichodesmium erythraeum (strain IMS101) TaxID=203124 RepID=Q111X7_TRIEI|nr:phosphoribosyl-AMP cyclohydrolase [Trichodesmium erythraeum GBRTRLIN201]MCH2047968.1 phosphoribosyl-AMP cyclohydrolase [Trichodesmium sp. ALOHA_ZT_67]MDT9338173.1 phosphoribosyl-AMP cyclohydrolase [Trichodesmium erythraeum 21-75]